MNSSNGGKNGCVTKTVEVFPGSVIGAHPVFSDPHQMPLLATPHTSVATSSAMRHSNRRQCAPVCAMATAPDARVDLHAIRPKRTDGLPNTNPVPQHPRHARQ